MKTGSIHPKTASENGFCFFRTMSVRLAIGVAVGALLLLILWGVPLAKVWVRVARIHSVLAGFNYPRGYSTVLWNILGNRGFAICHG